MHGLLGDKLLAAWLSSAHLLLHTDSLARPTAVREQLALTAMVIGGQICCLLDVNITALPLIAQRL